MKHEQTCAERIASAVIAWAFVTVSALGVLALIVAVAYVLVAALIGRVS